jgi:hypothetical protein
MYKGEEFEIEEERECEKIKEVGGRKEIGVIEGRKRIKKERGRQDGRKKKRKKQRIVI